MQRNLYSYGLFFILLICSFWPTSLAAQQVSQRTVSVTGKQAAQPNEVSVAINPANPDNVVLVSMQRKFPDGSNGITNYAYVTYNNGKRWQQVDHPNPEKRTQGDDAVDFASDGTVFHSYISFSQLRTPQPLNASNGIFVTRSDDGGASWQEPTPVVDHLNTVAPFEDKPWLTVDNQSASEHTGNIYVSWTRFDRYHSDDPADSSQIYFSRSTDGGENFLMPYDISDQGGNAMDNSNTVEGAVPAVGPDGTVYIGWAGPRGIVVDRSTDGGQSFGNDIRVASNPGGWDMEISGINRANGLPVTATDVSDGDYRGSVYINWVDQRHGDPDVFLAYSRDRGESWSDPIRVNGDPRGNGKEQFFSWMAVDPTDGAIYIAYYDRAGLDGTQTSLTLSRSTDGGQSFNHYSVDQSPFSTQSDIFFGDYLGIDAYGGKVVIGYQHFTGPDELSLSASIFRFK